MAVGLLINIPSKIGSQGDSSVYWRSVVGIGPINRKGYHTIVETKLP